MPKLNLDGTEYEFPNLAELNMEQARILKRYTGKSLEELEDVSFSDPDFAAAICHLALWEDNPTRSFSNIERQVNATKLADMIVRDEEPEAEQTPPVPEPSEPSADASSSEPEHSAPNSGETSDANTDATPETPLRSIGTAG